MRLALAAGLLFGLVPLYLVGSGRYFGNNDEAIYAELARDMAGFIDWLTPYWQGQPVWSRPPVGIWPLALGVLALGDGEGVLRGMVALQAAASVVLLFLYVARRHGTGVGLTAALLLATSGGQLAQARVLQTESTLLVFVLAALYAWERAREQPAWMRAWGVCLGLALLTRQGLGALPLLAPLADSLAGRRPRLRALAPGLVLAGAVVGGWLAVQSARFGLPFLREQLALEAHSFTTPPAAGPAFHLASLWRHEGGLVLVAGVGLLHAVRRRDALAGLWLLLLLPVLSLPDLRFESYTLLVYPPLLLVTARVVCEVGRAWLVLPLLATWAASHVGQASPPKYRAPDAVVARLAQVVGVETHADDVVLVIGAEPFSARYYSDRFTVALAPDPAELERKSRSRLPVARALVSDFAAHAKRHPRWSVIVPAALATRVHGARGLHLLGSIGAYAVYTNATGPFRPRAGPLPLPTRRRH